MASQVPVGAATGASAQADAVQATPDIAHVRERLMDAVADCYADPMAYLRLVMPWGTPELPMEGPRDWQAEILDEWGRHIRDQGYDGTRPVKPWLASVVSGHGSGKTALTAWITKFLHDTRPFSKGSITAASTEQLRTKTWAEVGKWHRLSITSHWSDYTAGSSLTLRNRVHGLAWAASAYKPSKENFEAFQGQHSNTSSYYLFDEASSIPDKFYEVARGGLAHGEPHLWAFGNGTRASGFFFDSHNNRRARRVWTRRQIDVRAVREVSPHMYGGFIEEYGLDSDVVRVRVLGQFPELAEYQYIPVSAVDLAQDMPSAHDAYAPLVMGVDVARGGGDRSVIQIRRGTNARDPRGDDGARIHRPVRSWGKNDANMLEDAIHELCMEHAFRGIFIETHGLGGPVIDHLNRRQIPNVIGVNLQERVKDGRHWDRKTKMISVMREEMKAGRLAIPEDTEADMDAAQDAAFIGAKGDLRGELLAIEADLAADGTVRVLPPPDGHTHPDFAMALALTFAYPIPADPREPDFGREAELRRRASTPLMDRIGGRGKARSPLDGRASRRLPWRRGER